MQESCDFITDDMVFSGVALAGGGARSTLGSCGAYAGGLMTLSAKLSPHVSGLSPEQIEELERGRVKFYEFRDWFKDEFGGVSCYEALHKLFGGYYDQADEKSRKELKDLQDRLGFNCHVVTDKTVTKLKEMLGV